MADDQTIDDDVILEVCPETQQTIFTRNLLESGLLSDVEVHHGNDVFKCHRILLCTHSEWFRDQLMDKTTNGGDLPNHVKLPDDFSRGEVQLILESMYASSVSVMKFLGKRSQLEGLIRVWRLAHYFGIDSLESKAVNAFHEAIDAWYKLYGLHLRDETLASFPTARITALIDAMYELYRDNRIDAHPTFRSPLLATALCGIHKLRANADMASLLDSSPSFAADWARVLMHRWTEHAESSDQDVGFFGDSSPSATGTSPGCARCYEQFDEEDPYALFPNLLRWAKKDYYEELCSSCLPKITLEEWMKA